MKYWWIILGLFFILGCNTTNSLNPKQILPEYAKNFFLSVQGQDTVLHIIHGKDTLTFNKQKESSFHLLSTTQAGFFSLLKNFSNIHGVVYPNDIHSKEIQECLRNRQIVDLNPGQSEINHELLWQNPVAYILYSPFDPIDFPLPKETIKIPFLDYTETHPLGRLEWIKVIGFLSNKHKVSERIFNEKVNQYKKNVCTSRQSKKVLVGSWDGEFFYINSTQSTIHQTLVDAGLTAFSSEEKGNTQWDKEVLWSKLPEVDHIVWITTQQQKNALEKEMQQPESWQKKWGIIPHFIFIDTCAYFQEAIIQPDKLLIDFSQLNVQSIKTFVTN